MNDECTVCGGEFCRNGRSSIYLNRCRSCGDQLFAELFPQFAEVPVKKIDVKQAIRNRVTELRQGTNGGTQRGRVLSLMQDGRERTLEEIRKAVKGSSTDSVGAALRILRRPEFGGYTIRSNNRGGVWVYQLVN